MVVMVVVVVVMMMVIVIMMYDAGKIEMVKSKWGLALSAMITVFASLLMSVSLCVFFGLTPSLSGRFAHYYVSCLDCLSGRFAHQHCCTSPPIIGDHCHNNIRKHSSVNRDV